jgi:hypothetical protein
MLKQRSAAVRHLILLEVRKQPKPHLKNNSSGTRSMFLPPEANIFLVDPLFFTHTCINFTQICLNSSNLEEIKRTKLQLAK